MMQSDSPPVRLVVRGMTCGACSARVQRIAGMRPEVAAAEVSLPAAAATIQLAPELTPSQRDAAVRELVEAINAAGFQASLPENPAAGAREMWDVQQQETQAQLAALQRRLGPAFAAAVPLFVLSMGEMLGLPLPALLSPHRHPLVFALTQLALVLPVVWVGRDYYRVGVKKLLGKAPNMDSLIALGTGAALLHSVWNTIEMLFVHDPSRRMHLAMDLYYETAAVIIALVALGKYFELRSRARASEAIHALLALTPETASLVRLAPGQNPATDGTVETVPVGQVRPGDVVLVRSGERVPVDGEVLWGEASLDESMLTGESLPVDKAPGDGVAGGSVSVEGSFRLRASRVGEETLLARIIALVRQAQAAKAPVANLADRVSLHFVPAVMVLAVLAGLGWLLAGESAAFAFRVGVSVLVVACPCAMGLATPTSIMVATGRGARLGVLFKTGLALEQTGRLQVVVFDKTGTLTEGRPVLADVAALDPNLSEEDCLRLAAGTEGASEHPLAKAIVRAARERGLAPPPALSFETRTGRGVRATLRVGEATRTVTIGSPAHLVASGADLSGLEHRLQAQADAGRTALVMTVDGAPAALLALADRPRPEARRVLVRLREMGVRPLLLTGDSRRTALAVARELGLDEADVVAEVLPEDKARHVASLKTGSSGETRLVGMVGDGVNDAPALATADVGLAMGSGVDVAVETGDVVLLRSGERRGGGLEGVVTAMALSRATRRNIIQNLGWAFGYNILGLPIAAGLLHALGGPAMNPMVAGAAMALSSVSVVTNALRLRWFQPPDQA